MTNADRFVPIFAQLKTIMQRCQPQLVVDADTLDHYSLSTPRIEQLKKTMFFGAVQIKKQYVSYHLMPLYNFPALLDDVSPALKRRMQGKSCFNFTTLDQTMFDELADLTARDYEQFQREYQFEPAATS